MYPESRKSKITTNAKDDFIVEGIASRGISFL